MSTSSISRVVSRFFGQEFAARLTRQSIVVLGLHVSGVGLGYVVQVFLARWAGAPAYGDYTYAFAWASTISAVVGLGIPPAMLRFIPVYRAESDWGRLRGLLKRAGTLTTGLSTAFSLLGTGVVLGLGLGGSPEETALFLLGAWAVPVLAVVRLQSETLRAAGRLYWTYVPMLLARPLLVAIGSYALLKLDASLTGSEIMAVAVGVMIVILLARVAVLRHSFPADIADAAPVYETRVWLRTALPLLMITFFLFIVGHADLLMVGLMVDTTSVGFYSAAARTAGVIAFPLLAVNAVSGPMISRIHKREGSPGLQRLARTTVHFIFWLSLGLTAAVFVGAEIILGFFGPGFVTAAPALRILSAGHLINAATGQVGAMLDLTGHQHLSVKVYGASAILNILLNAVAIPFLGMTGAALTTAATMALTYLWLYALVVKNLRVQASIFGMFTYLLR